MNAIGGDANHHVSVNGSRSVPSAAKAAPWPDPSLAFTDVQDLGAPMPRTPGQGTDS